MLLLIVALLPSRVKILVLRKFYKATIGRRCYIGLSIISGESICIGDDVFIGHFNLLWRLKTLQIASGCNIRMGNWITGARSGSFLMGKNTAITRFHFFEASGNISIGANTIIAGRGSHFFTHGHSPEVFDDIRSISIGEWNYVGSSSRFVPGSSTGGFTFVGMGAVVTKVHPDSYVLLGGVPAAVQAPIMKNCKYFSRSFLIHDNHSSEYVTEQERASLSRSE